MLSTASRLLARRTAAPALGAVRNLNVHEYISMEMFKAHGIQTPECHVANTPEEAMHLVQTKFNKRK
jgi:succinyl-CoA synthetase beta subunit